MSLRGISEAAYRSVKICSLGQNRMSANSAGTFLSNCQNRSAVQRRADGIGGAAKLRPLAQGYRVKISNFRHNHLLPLQHNAAKLYS